MKLEDDIQFRDTFVQTTVAIQNMSGERRAFTTTFPKQDMPFLQHVPAWHDYHPRPDIVADCRHTSPTPKRKGSTKVPDGVVIQPRVPRWMFNHPKEVFPKETHVAYIHKIKGGQMAQRMRTMGMQQCLHGVWINGHGRIQKICTFEVENFPGYFKLVAFLR